MTTLHFATTPEGIETLDSPAYATVTAVDGTVPRLVLYPMGEGNTSWEQIGEPPAVDGEYGDDSPGDLGIHTLIRCPSVASAFENLGWLIEEGIPLVPMRWPGQEGTIAMIDIDDEEWGEDTIVIQREHSLDIL